MTSSASRLAAQTRSRSIRSGVVLAACSGAASSSTYCRCAGFRFWYSGMASIRRYSGLMYLRLIGRYGELLTGQTGSGACSGLIRMKPAPSWRADQLARSARSCRSPWPQERGDLTEYSWTVNPQDRWPGSLGRTLDPGSLAPGDLAADTFAELALAPLAGSWAGCSPRASMMARNVSAGTSTRSRRQFT